MKYKGYTHYVPLFLLPVWKKLFCRINWHLWDEVSAPYNGWRRYLGCDACDEEVHIAD